MSSAIIDTKISSATQWQPVQAGEIKNTNRAAATIMRRAGFGANASQISRLSQYLKQNGSKGACHEARRIWQQDGKSNFNKTLSLLENATMAGGESKRNSDELSSWWLYKMAHTPDPIRERITLFWHGHFATSNRKVQSRRAMMNQYQLIHQHALDQFEPMVQGISKDPAMLVWLDATNNRKARPNENYARELLELFCLGEGNYTENDIKEIARCFTGWELKRGIDSAGSFHFNKYQHDTGEKSFLGHRGAFSGEQAVKLVLTQSSAAQFLTGKLVRYYIAEEPGFESEALTSLANQYRQSRYKTGDLLTTLLESRSLLRHHAGRITSPVEMAISFLRAFDASTNMKELAIGLERLGQSVFYPPTVKGWDGGRNWLDTSTIIGRANGIMHLLESKNTRYKAGSLAETAAAAGATTPVDWVDWLQDLFIPTNLPRTCLDQLLRAAKSNSNEDEAIKNTMQLLSITPEFHLG